MKSPARTILLALALAMLAASPLTAAPASRLWERWTAHVPTSTRVVDHGPWDRFIAGYLDSAHPSGIARLAYRKVSSADRARLEAYLAALQATPVSALSRGEQFAYWVNLYNAATVKLILDRYPVDSILKVNPGGIIPRGPWDARILVIEGEEVTLNDIEHRILRPIWKDPRVHFAVNCASLGCPNLQPRAYTAANTEELLTTAARQYVNHPRGVSFQDGSLRMSSIFSWYGVDFGGSLAEQLATLARFAEPQLAAQLLSYTGRARYGYDWGLNE